MSATPMPMITEGQTVRIEHASAAGCVFVVERVKYTKAIVRGADEATRKRYPRGLDAPMTMLRPVDGEGSWPAPRNVEADSAQRLAELEHKMQFELGVLVQLKRPYNSYTEEDVFVVTANNDKTVSVVKIGGDGGRYLRVPHSGLGILSAKGLHLDDQLHVIA
jgi:hypothetical protein